MIRFIGNCIAILALLCMATASEATPPALALGVGVVKSSTLADCGRYQRSAYGCSYAAPAVATYVQPVVAKVVEVYLPSYSVTYDPTGGAGGLAIQQELKESRAEVRELRATVGRLESFLSRLPAPAPAPAPEYLPAPDPKAPTMPPADHYPPVGKAPSGAPAGSGYATKCASCHDSASSSKSGPVLSDRGILRNTDKIPEKVMDVIMTGKMGSRKTPPITAEEKVSLYETLLRMPPPELASKE